MQKNRHFIDIAKHFSCFYNGSYLPVQNKHKNGSAGKYCPFQRQLLGGFTVCTLTQHARLALRPVPSSVGPPPHPSPAGSHFKKSVDASAISFLRAPLENSFFCYPVCLLINLIGQI